MAVNTIIFDLGGVIFDSSNANVELFVSQEFDLPLNQVRSTLFFAGKTLIEGKISENHFWNSYAKEMKRELPHDWWEKWKNFNKDNFKIKNTVFEIVVTLQNRGYRLPLLSNISTFQLEILRSKTSLLSFSPHFFSCEIGLSNPDQSIFHAVLKTLALKPQECIFIDDDLENIRTSSSLGIDSIHFISALDLKKHLKHRQLL